MKFDIFANRIVNLEAIETIERNTLYKNIKKKYDEDKQVVVQEVEGEPFQILVVFASGRTWELNYKLETERDAQYRRLEKGLADA